MSFIHNFIIHSMMAYGIFAVCGFIFIETGLFLGFILPGDTILLLAGVYASKGILSLWEILFFVSICAILGNFLGYYFGYQLGEAFFHRKDSVIFNEKNILKAHEFFDKYGAISIFLARFMGYIRPFVPLVAGIGEMELKEFSIYSITSGILWVWSIVLVGFYLGRHFKNAINIVNYLLLFVVLISIVAVILAFVKRGLMKYRKQV